MFIIWILLLGIGVALFRRNPEAFLAGSSQDAPTRLLGWTAGLLSGQRDQWGQAMLGELANIEGRGRRWRFTAGCVGAALLMPPWGRRAGTGVLALIALSVAGLGVYSWAVIRYGLDNGSWVMAGIMSLFLVSFIAAGSVLLRRPGVAGPGLLGGLFVSVAWLAVAGFTFSGVIAPWTSSWPLLLLLIVVPAVVGRGIARLAAISAGLGMFLFGTLAVAVLGAGGPPDDSNFTVSYIIGDRLGNNGIDYLVLLPLTTATIGWAAAAATGSIRGRLAPSAAPNAAPNIDSLPITAVGRAEPMTASEPGVTAGPLGSRRRTVRRVLLWVAVATVVLLAAASWIPG